MVRFFFVATGYGDKQLAFRTNRVKTALILRLSTEQLSVMCLPAVN